MPRRINVVSAPDRRGGDVESQTARAFFGLREILLRGEFGRGERISELPLVPRLGTSRTPIRMALERLAHMGLLDVVATGGFTVREFTLWEVLDEPWHGWRRSACQPITNWRPCAGTAPGWKTCGA